ncbi:PKD domain-containing protein [Pleionea sediminis]|uniref:PKD domain-containing protein n=1 Tax=Pleionea sediminis TaxID=2569479 RepID=UPI00118543BF|nr:Ig-like domain-containing protein [Pleionea sediminis]
MKFSLLQWIALIGFSINAFAETQITMDSDSGDWVGGGSSYELTESTGSFTISPSQNNLIVNYSGSDSSDFRYEFVAPNDRDLEAGAYLNAQRAPFRGPLNPGLSITGNGRGCNTISGYFYIYEYSFNESNPVIAIDFVQFCDSTVSSLTGSIRINSSLPVPYNLPFSVIDGPSSVQESEGFSLNGGFSSGGTSDITGYHWTQVSGPSVEFSQPNSSSTEVSITELVALGGEDIVVELEITTDNSGSDSSQFTVNAKSKSDPYSFFLMESASGDYIGQGRRWFYDESNSTIGISRNYDKGVSLNINGDSWWSADFAAPGDAELTVGLYDPATRFPFQDADDAGLSISGDGRGCNRSYGSFEVSSMVWDGQSPVSFRATYEQHCESMSAPLLSGEIAYNSLHPSVPTASAGDDLTINEGETLSLNGSGSYDSDGSIAIYQWSIDDPETTINSSDTSRANLDAPTLGDRVSSKVFTATLLIIDDLGYQAKDDVKITVLQNNAAPIANDDSAQVSVGGSVDLMPLLNDQDSDGRILMDSIIITSQPSFGNVIVESDGTVKYTHTGSATGEDSFTYKVSDNDGEISNSATFKLTISNSAPSDDSTDSNGSGGPINLWFMLLVMLCATRARNR